MPATLVQTQQQHKMPALGTCSTRTRHVGLPRSLEDLHACLLRVGARRAGISSLATKNAAPSCSKNKKSPGNGDDHYYSNHTPHPHPHPHPPAATRITTTTTPTAPDAPPPPPPPLSGAVRSPDFSPARSHQRPLPRLLPPAARYRRTPAYLGNGRPSAKEGGTTLPTPAISPGSSTSRVAAAATTQGVVSWVWGEDAAAVAAAAAAAAAAKEEGAHGGGGGVAAGGGGGASVLSLDDDDGERDGSSERGASPCEKLLFAKQACAAFDSTCSTEAPTERTLSVAGSQSSSSVLRVTSHLAHHHAHHHHHHHQHHHAHHIPRGKKSSGVALRRQQSMRGGPLRRQQSGKGKGAGGAEGEEAPVDDPFLHRLCDMSLRFPEPPTRPPPAPATSASRAVTISGWGKNIASSLPSVQVILPARWRKNLHSNKRCRKSTSLWVARSKATNSMTDASSFQQRNAARYNSKTSASTFISRSNDTPPKGDTSPNGVTPTKGNTPPHENTPPNGVTPPNGNTPPSGGTPPNGDTPHADDASLSEEQPCRANDPLLPVPLGNALPPPPPPPDTVAPAPPRTPATITLASSFVARGGVTPAAPAAGVAPAEAPAGAGVAAPTAPKAPARVWEWGDDPLNPYRINAGRSTVKAAAPVVAVISGERRPGRARGDLWGRARRGEARGWTSSRLPVYSSMKKGVGELWPSEREGSGGGVMGRVPR